MKKTFFIVYSVIACNCFSQTHFICRSGTGNGETVYAATLSADGSILAVGSSDYFYGDDNTNLYVVKLDASGQQQWSKMIKKREYAGYGIINTSDGGFAVSGAIGDTMALSKFDASGNLSWTKKYKEFSMGRAKNLIQTPDGGYLLPGTVDHDQPEAYLIKTDASGNVQWAKRYLNVIDINDIKKTAGNNYVFSSLNLDYNNVLTSIVKIDSSGDVIWSKDFYPTNTSGYGERSHILPSSDGGYVITGGVFSPSWESVAFILKLDSNGNYLWSKSTDFKSLGEYKLSDVIETSDSAYVAIGVITIEDKPVYSYPYQYLLKISNTGNMIWEKLLDYGKGYFSSGILLKTQDGGYVGVDNWSDTTDQVRYGLFTKFDANFNTCIPNKSGQGLKDFGALVNGVVPVYDGNPVVTSAELLVTTAGSTTNICTSLPLTLLDFSAVPKATTVNLKWQTAGEKNTAYFNVEKSMDGKAFNSFIQVKAVVNSTIVKYYSALDDNPFEGVNWYRLKMVDADGRYTYSNVIKITYTGEDYVLLYPNPVNNAAVIKFTATKAGIYKLELLDISGKSLQTKKGVTTNGENIITFDVSKYAKGLYIVKLTEEEHGTRAMNLIKQ